MNHLFDRLFATGGADAPAIVVGDETLTYAGLEAETAGWANALVAVGVGPGNRVAVQVEKSVAGLALYLAAVRAGAVFLPLNPAYTPTEVGYFLADAEPALFVCDPARREALAAIAGRARIETLGKEGEGSLAGLAAGSPAVFATLPRAAGDLAAICYTSGTTGRSKGAMLTHRALASNAATLKDLWRFTASDVLIHALPIYHVHGLFIATHVTLMAGAAMIFQPRFDAGTVLAAMPHATAMMGVPTFYTRLLDHPGLTREAVAGMRLFVSGSAPLLAQTHRAWTTRTGTEILERYGLTETGMNASHPYGGPRLPGSVGRALPGVSVRIVDDSGGAGLPPGETGIVQVKGPNVCAGYWRDEAKTAAAFTADGWFRTGDLGRLDDDAYLWLVGRSTDLIISGGLNVYPAEVEAAIDALPGVTESAVIGLPHPDFGEAVTAVVVGTPDLEAGAIATALESRLAGFKRPRRILFAAELPRNAMGKVTKAALRAAHATLYQPTDG
ncbi:MAG TPA: AMP-binding protein [Caulobacteraceae bacterium]